MFEGLIGLITGALAILMAVAFLVWIVEFLDNLLRPGGDTEKKVFRWWEPEEPEERRVGREGEIEATERIRRTLREEDVILTNVKIEVDGREAEFDNIVINRYGLFIIEVKNYSGELVGDREDETWTKYHYSKAGELYTKEVRNPIKQVNREVYLLSRYLKYYGIRTWVTGYVYFVEENAPFEDAQILQNEKEIACKLHYRQKDGVRSQDQKRIRQLLSD